MNEIDEIPEGFKITDEKEIVVICEKCNDAIRKVNPEKIKKITAFDPRMAFPKLCKECKHQDPYVTRQEFDGAKKISYPPENHLGSRNKHRRRRYTAYENCKNCEGKGRIKISRSHARGGSYYAQCKECSSKYRSNPFRKAKKKTKEKLYQQIKNKYDQILKTRIRSEGYVLEEDIKDMDEEELEKGEDIKRANEHKEEIQKEIASPLLEKMNEKQEKAREHVEEHFKEAIEMKNQDKEKAIMHIKKSKNQFTITDKPKFEHEIPAKTQQAKLTVH